jgi:hypothetical protein
MRTPATLAQRYFAAAMMPLWPSPLSFTRTPSAASRLG